MAALGDRQNLVRRERTFDAFSHIVTDAVALPRLEHNAPTRTQGHAEAHTQAET